MGLFDAIEVMIEVVEAADEVPDAKEVCVVSDLSIFPFVFFSAY